MKRNVGVIEALHAKADPMVVLSDDCSPWSSDVYIEVTKDIPGARMVSISGTFLSRVFEGPYRNMKKWIAEMHAHVAARGKSTRKMYFFYTTCPRCAKKHGKNYVVILARV
ncbi:MAG: hydrolase [Bacteroidota bacterium]